MSDRAELCDNDSQKSYTRLDGLKIALAAIKRLSSWGRMIGHADGLRDAKRAIEDEIENEKGRTR